MVVGRRRGPTIALLSAIVVLASATTAWGDGPDLFVANQGNAPVGSGGTANIAAFTIGAGGALAPFMGSPFAVPAGSFPYGPAVTPDDRYLFVPDLVSKVLSYAVGSGTITAGSTQTVASGSPTPVESLVSPDGRRLYVTSLGAATVSGYSIGGGGALTPLPGSPYPVAAASPESLAMTPDGAHLYVAGFASSHNQLEAFNVASDGSLAPVAGSLYSLGINTNGLAITPGGGFLYASSEDATAEISIFAIHSDGTLTAEPAPGPPAGPPSFGPLPSSPPAISPDGQHLYLAQADGTVAGYAIGSGGALTAIAGSPFTGVPAGGGAYTWDLQLAPDGKEMYALAAPQSLTTDGDVATFDVAADGALSLRPGTVDTGGNQPFQDAMTISPDPGPVAVIVPPPTLVASARQLTYPISFAAAGSHATDSLYGALTYNWNFGDGTTLDNGGPSPTHTYLAAGTYTASLTVTDGAGCSASLIWTGTNSYCAADPAATASTTVTVMQPLHSVLPPHLTTARVGNQRITLSSPSLQVCVGGKLELTLRTQTIRRSKAARARFTLARFYIDGGVEHRHRHKRTTYSPNATVRRRNATVGLSLGGLKHGTHTLTVKVSFHETRRRHGHEKTVTVTATLRTKFKVC